MGPRKESNIRHSYPGDGYYYITCAVCGKKMRARDGILAQDIYKKNLIVCKDDLDVDNPQTYIKAKKERRPPPAIWNRGEGTDTFVVNENTDRVPSAPQNIRVIGYDGTKVYLQWMGPVDPGSGTVQGYKIEFVTPGTATTGFTTVIADTGTGAGYYEHTYTFDEEGQTIRYKVYAINDAGTGPAGLSNIADSDNTVELLITEDGESYIITESNEYIRID